ncbi:general substrate transporter [Dothidotthia symphoricarpi CBS 119687]|uniref:General substrate transporter n=1 Tax=Dothidotthia symphoricarpi CBS 119687 TaxID=1392245 RepID=A0A6A5ZWH2_9PLEO|nr:general substrate transporter [Dothidotthia symphoricarpi CBS 119687]KAF2123294.1 general substrate transporter [Dothidotthia symphoricarpi CBS 119687]
MWNPWRENLKDTPKESLNWRLWYGVFVFGIMGAARGIDEGLIGTTAELKPFIKKFGLDDPTKSKHDLADLLSNITSMVQMGSILGSLIAFAITDRIGRLWSTRLLCLIWVTGITIFLTSSLTGSVGQIYAGRFIAGVGIGQTTVVAPTYLAETAPRAIRGLCVGAFSGSVYLGIMLAYFASWGSSIHISSATDKQWLVPNSMHIMFAGLIFILSFFASESPRWLIKVGRHEEALENMSRLRKLPADHPYITSEIIDINDQLNREREATMGTTWLGPIRELFSTKANLYRIQLSIMSQLLGQWSGANSITIYAPQYFAMMGTTGQKEKLFATAIFGVVKFVSSIICALFLIDYIGRKRSLTSGITLQFVSMLYMALFLLIDTGVSNKSIPQTPSQKRAAMAAIVAIYSSGFGWALGWNSIQYLINSEIYPLRLRALGGSLAMTFHFVNQYGNSKAVPLMFLSMTTGGTMMFFSCVTGLGLFWVWFFLPETSGKSLEALDEIFNLPWHLIGRKGAQLTRGTGGMSEVLDTAGEKAATAQMEDAAERDGVQTHSQRMEQKV